MNFAFFDSCPIWKALSRCQQPTFADYTLSNRSGKEAYLKLNTTL